MASDPERRILSLPGEELARFLLEGYAIHASAASAIIARLGTRQQAFGSVILWGNYLPVRLAYPADLRCLICSAG